MVAFDSPISIKLYSRYINLHIHNSPQLIFSTWICKNSGKLRIFCLLMHTASDLLRFYAKRKLFLLLYATNSYFFSSVDAAFRGSGTGQSCAQDDTTTEGKTTGESSVRQHTCDYTEVGGSRCHTPRMGSVDQHGMGQQGSVYLPG